MAFAVPVLVAVLLAADEPFVLVVDAFGAEVGLAVAVAGGSAVAVAVVAVVDSVVVAAGGSVRVLCGTVLAACVVAVVAFVAAADTVAAVSETGSVGACGCVAVHWAITLAAGLGVQSVWNTPNVSWGLVLPVLRSRVV